MSTLAACSAQTDQTAELPPINTEPNVSLMTELSVTIERPATTTTTDPLANVNWEALEVAIRDEQRKLYGRCGEWHDAAIDAGFTEDEWPKVRHIIGRETGDTCDETAHNDNVRTGDDSYGLTQINLIGNLWPARAELCGLSAPTDLLDGPTNLRCARKIYERSGWAPWRL